jgi:hypothetical protein
MGAFDDLIPSRASSGAFDDLIPKQKTQDDFNREVLAEMPWAQRQLVGAGGALYKGYQGVKGLFGGEVDQAGVRAADVAGEEAPIGSMVGEIAKYAPVALAGTAVLPAAAASAVLGFVYDPTGNRMSSAAQEGAFGAGGALIGKAIPRVAGSVGNSIQRLRELIGGEKSARYYGGADKASDALKKIVGVDNQVAASRMLREAGDVRSAQALADMPNAENMAVLDKLMRSDAGVAAAADPIEAANLYNAQAARQAAGRTEVMEQMARGSTAEDSAIARDLFSKMSAAELVPIRDSILGKIRQTGKTLDEILPELSQKEAMYVSALQNQGRMATEAAQQGVLATGQRAADGQLIRNLPEGNFPRDPSIVQPTGAPRGAFPVDGMPRVPPRYAPNVGPQSQFAAAADELGGVASAARTEADALRAQISALPSSFTAAPVRNAVDSMATGLNATKRNVASKLAEELRIAGDDPVKLAEIRAMTINTLIPDLVDGSNAQKAAAAALTDIKKVIDKQLGDEFVTRYLEPYSKKLEYRSSLELADKLRDLQQNQPKMFLKVMQGNDPELVKQYGNWDTIKQALGERRFGKAEGVAKSMQVDRDLKDMAKSPEAKAAVKSLLANESMTRHLPNLLNRYVVLMNTAVEAGEMKINKGMYRELEQAVRNPAKMAELIDMLPPEQRSKMIGYAAELGKAAPVAAAAYGEQVRK